MDDDLTLLASAYLDGDTTPDERARVEGDPSLLAEVERLRTVRAVLRDPDRFERPPDAARETAIAAALAVSVHSRIASAAPSAAPFDASSSARQPRVLRFERRRAASRVLAVAAAAVALAGFGVVLTQLDDGRDDDSDTAAVEAPAATMAADETLAAGAQPAPGDTMVPMLAADATTGADASTESAESDSGPTARADAPSDGATATEPTSEIEAPPAPSLESPDELAAFAADAATALGEQGLEPLPPPCESASVDDVEFVATGTYRGQPVVIGTDGDRAIAIDPESCEIVAEARLP